MHLIPAERSDHRMIDPERVCEAIAGLREVADIPDWVRMFAVLSDPTRLRLLICIKSAGSISVSDLAVAADISDATVSQTLRFLRAGRVVRAERDGRVIRYQLEDPAIGELIDRVIHAGGRSAVASA